MCFLCCEGKFVNGLDFRPLSAFDNGDDCDDHDLVGTTRAARVMILCGIITRRQNIDRYFVQNIIILGKASYIHELCDGDIGTFQVVFSLLSLFNSISNLEIKSFVYSLQLCYLIDELTQAKLRT